MKILVAPLDWGLGHATRCIPIIRACIEAGHSVELATCGSIATLYRGEFPELAQHEFPSYGIRYPKVGLAMPLWLLKNMPRLRAVMAAEHQRAEELVKECGFDAIISDNRFGCYSVKAHSVYMTHQLRIAFPFPFSYFEKTGTRYHAKFMQRFSEVWVPDIPDFPGLAGKLSHVLQMPLPVKYVGILSRFAEPVPGTPREYDFLGVISGPEPMRSSFQNRLIAALSEIPGKHAVILGTPGRPVPAEHPKNVTLFSHLETPDFARMVAGSRHIVSRSGYSTVMDMARLGANCVFVPTPGQTEQVYLGRVLRRSGFAGYLPERKLSAETLLESAAVTRRIPESPDSKGLLAAVLMQLR